MRQPVRVVLADDHDAFVEGLGMVLDAEHDLEVVALAGDGASALQAVLTHHPDVLVVDTHMPGPAVTELVRMVGQAEPHHQGAAAGRGRPARPVPGPQPGRSRQHDPGRLGPRAGRGHPGGGRRLPGHPGRPRPPTRRTPDPPAAADQPPDRPERDDHAELLLRSLSERERQILTLLARGYSNRRMAEVSVLSLNTVRTHVQNVLVKLGVHSKLEAAALAVRRGLVSIEDPTA